VDCTPSGDATIPFTIDLKEMLEAGCHFGHQARRWNPKMTRYIYTERDGVHIFDLTKTAAQPIEKAMAFVTEWVASGKEIVFVGTKRQAREIVLEEATQAGAPYIVERWLGGTLTNWEQMQGTD
jgi:small subunit ribosomal protein S2